MPTRSLHWDTCGDSEEKGWWESETSVRVKSGIMPHYYNKKAVSIMQIGKQLFSVWAQISLDFLPISENTSERAINMSTDFNGLFFVPFEVVRKTAQPRFGSVSKKKK